MMRILLSSILFCSSCIYTSDVNTNFYLPTFN